MRPVFGPSLVTATLLCLLAPSVVAAGGRSVRSLQQAAPAVSSCPLEFKPRDIQDTVKTCTQGNGTGPAGDPRSLFYKPSCCRRLYGLVYQSRVRYANSSDHLLISQEAQGACIEVLQASLVTAGLPPALFATCSVNITSMSQPSCGDQLTTVSAFKTLTNFSYPGFTTSSACWGQPDCSSCITSLHEKVASLQRIAGVSAALIATGECQDLAKVALVAAAYPLTIANSIATCLWDTPVDYYPQSPSCPDFDHRRFDFSGVYKSCGPPGIHSELCCDTVWALSSIIYFERINRTRETLFETEAVACGTALKNAFVANGLPISLYERCQLSNFGTFVANRCNNYTDTPPELKARVEAACAPGECNRAGDCTDMVSAATSVLAGPDADQTTYSLCGVFLGLTSWPQFGVQGCIDRANCFWDFPPELQLRIAPPVSPGSARNRAVIYLVTVTVVVTLLAVTVATLWLWRRRRRARQSLRDQEALRARLSKSAENMELLRWYSFAELQKATQNFAPRALLGRGASGKVFVGTLADGTKIAVKQLQESASAAGVEELVTEVSSIGSCRHRHVLAIKGIHASKQQILMVYDYMPNGSLDDHLFAPLTSSPTSPPAQGCSPCLLDWNTRHKIALGTAKGLAYLHEDCKPRIIHRDVKPSNILLDEVLEAKIGDFGLAKFRKDGDTHLSTGVRGTWGYLSPEYVAMGQVSEKSDVYAFGVVLLALVTGRRPTESARLDEQVFLTEWAWAAVEGGDPELLRLVDPVLTPCLERHASSMLIALKVGLLCVHTVVHLRPTMRDCVAILLRQMDLPPMPPRPTTLFTMSSFQTGSTSTSTTLTQISELGSNPSELDLSRDLR